MRPLVYRPLWQGHTENSQRVICKRAQQTHDGDNKISVENKTHSKAMFYNFSAQRQNLALTNP